MAQIQTTSTNYFSSAKPKQVQNQLNEPPKNYVPLWNRAEER